jgi:hypothetical protein
MQSMQCNAMQSINQSINAINAINAINQSNKIRGRKRESVGQLQSSHHSIIKFKIKLKDGNERNERKEKKNKPVGKQDRFNKTRFFKVVLPAPP